MKALIRAVMSLHKKSWSGQNGFKSIASFQGNRLLVFTRAFGYQTFFVLLVVMQKGINRWVCHTLYDGNIVFMIQTVKGARENVIC